jgi:hypothetical protein
MAEYKARRARKRASGGKAGEGKEGPPHGHMIILIGLGKKQKKKAGGKVEGAAARRHLGKRARGGPAKRADGGQTDDNWNEFMGEQARQNALEGDKSPTPWSHEDRSPAAKRVETGDGSKFEEAGQARRVGSTSATPVEFQKRARGGRAPSDGPRILDAREDAQETGQDGRDKVSQRSGTEERAVEMSDARKRGGHVMRKRADGGATESDFDKPMTMPDRVMSQGSSNSRRWYGKQPPPPKPIEDEGRARGGRLTAAERHKMPSSEFALPGRGEGQGGKGSGSYPINDASHARNALARVSQHGSPAEQKRVRAAVHRKFPDIGRE